MEIEVEYMWYKMASETLEEVDCFKYLMSQAAADGGCETM